MQTIHVILSVKPSLNPGPDETGQELVFVEEDRHHDYNTAIRKLAKLKSKNPKTRFTIIDEYEFEIE